ncbi:MAG: response regulator transcription factor [Thermoflexales bacterium]|nr:response regulator transcription factor [Thermoflexales bacterium]
MCPDNTITVFLAEDSTMLRDTMRYMLEAQPDFHVVGDAADGEEAVRQVAALQKAALCPDIVIMDITMPKLDGLEATRQLLELCPHTHVIILSIHKSPEYITHALQAGAHGYLLKESAGRELIEAIQMVQAGHYYLPSSISDQVVAGYKQQLEVAHTANLLASLSPREREILQLIAEGKSNDDISTMLCLSPKSVHTYRKRLMEKLDIHDLPGLIKFAITHGLVPLA